MKRLIENIIMKKSVEKVHRLLEILFNGTACAIFYDNINIFGERITPYGPSYDIL